MSVDTAASTQRDAEEEMAFGIIVAQDVLLDLD